MAFRNKADVILAYRPDILVVPECEHPDNLKFAPNTPLPSNVLWFGTNRHKGLGVFSYSNLKLKVRRIHKPEFRMIVPIAVSGGNIDFTLYAVWANNPEDRDGAYITQVWKAMKHYEKSLKKGASILAGDFNSNTIWDRPRREGNHSTVVQQLENKGIHSVYHKYFKQLQGKEQHPTQYMYRHKDKPYHLDYCFASDAILQKLSSVEIGEYDFWRKYSDHVPVIVSFDIN